MDYKITKLCDEVETLTHELVSLVEGGYAGHSCMVIAVMKLSAVASELMYEDLISRIRLAR